MTVQEQLQALLLLPKKLNKKQKWLRDIKAVGLRVNVPDLIDEKYHEAMLPPLKVWI